MARAVETTVASPAAALDTVAASVRSIKLGGSIGVWCHVRSELVSSFAKLTKYS